MEIKIHQNHFVSDLCEKTTLMFKAYFRKMTSFDYYIMLIYGLVPRSPFDGLRKEY